MFRKIWNWFRKEESIPVGGVMYRPKDRMIFGYYDGEKEVLADPMILYKRIMDIGTELSVEMKVMRSKSKGARAAHDSAVAKLRKVFDVKSLEDGGLTEVECLELFDVFINYCDLVKKNSSPTPTSATETSASTRSTSEEIPPTSNISDSGSTKEESSTAMPTQPTSEPVLPSVPSMPDSVSGKV